MRKKIVAGNWKMNKNYSEAVQLMFSLKDFLSKSKKAEGVIKIVIPPSLYIHDFYESTKGLKNLFVGAQNCSYEESGAYTGEISAEMIKSVGGSYMIIGHSERRSYFKETHEELKKKTDMTIKHSLSPIFCVGETKDKREAGEHFNVVKTQINDSIFHLQPDNSKKLLLHMSLYGP